jgi:4-diphosphocytidyl-2-C-methyl-D-erythritol kinase
LTKNLPIGSGIGGGSADAAATLRAMSRLTGATLPADSGLSLGADVPVCLQSTACRMQGIGDVLTPIPEFPKYAAVLVCPKPGHKTPSVFSALKHKENAPVPELPSQFETTDFLTRMRNDLEKPSIELLPEIRLCLDEIIQNGAILARMSGSGATCFGLFETDQAAQEAAMSIASQHPDWWVRCCVLGG